MFRNRGQSAVEFIITHAWSLVIITVFLVVISIFIFSRSSSTYVPSSCYIEPALPCTSIVFTSNSVSSQIFLSFTNNLGITMHFATNAFTAISPSFSQGNFLGLCYPANAPPRAQVVCNATEVGYSASTGSSLNFPFIITYELCSPVCANTIYNTAGTATVYATQAKTLTALVTLLTSSGTGNVIVQGVGYPSGTQLRLVAGATYMLNAGAAPGSSFKAWASSGNVVLANNAISTTTFSANGLGTITLVYQSKQ